MKRPRRLVRLPSQHNALTAKASHNLKVKPSQLRDLTARANQSPRIKKQPRRQKQSKKQKRRKVGIQRINFIFLYLDTKKTAAKPERDLGPLPKKPSNAYTIFTTEFSAKEGKITDLMKKASEAWK